MSSGDERMEALAEVFAQHIAEAGGWYCSCQPVDETEGTRDLLEGTWEAHLADILLDSPAMRDLLAEAWDAGFATRTNWRKGPDAFPPSNPYREEADR